MKQVEDDYPQWRLVSLYVPACDESVYGDGGDEYKSKPVLCVDSYNDFRLCYVRETRYSDQSLYEWIEVGREHHLTDDIVYWQYLPAKPDAGRR